MSKEKFKCTKELLEKAKNGDKEAIAFLYENTKNIAYKKAYSILKNHHDAEDIAEDTFVKTLEKLDTIKRPGEFTSWINKVAENKAKDLIKKSKPTYMGEDFEYTTDDPNSDQSVLPENVAESNENIDLYKQLISKLTDNQRTALVLNRIEGRTFKEIAEMLGRSESTVKSRVHLGEEKLKKEAEKLKKKGYTLNGMMPLDFFTYMSNTLGVTSSNISVILGSATTKSLSLKAMVSIVTAILIAFGGLLSTNFLYGTPEPKQNGLTKPTTTPSSTIETTALKSSSQKETTVIKTIATDKQTTIPKKVVPQTVPITMATKNYQVITKVPSTTPKKNNDPETTFSKAFSAYKNVLRKYASEIKSRNNQSNKGKSGQIVFADILGDDTPEMILTKDNKNLESITLSIYTYDNGECKQIGFRHGKFVGTGEYILRYYFVSDEESPYFESPYFLYQKANEKNLYIFIPNDDTPLIKLSNNYNKAEIDPDTKRWENTVEFDVLKNNKKNIFNDRDKLLIYDEGNSKKYSKYCNSKNCESMSFNKAMKFVGKYNNDNKDYSSIIGTYFLVKNGNSDYKIKINSSGGFNFGIYSTESSFTILDIKCNGVIKKLNKVNDKKCTFYFSDLSFCDEGSFNKTKNSKSIINTKDKVVFYAKGTLPSEMDKNDYKAYKSFFNDNDSPIKNSIIILRNKSRDMCEVYIKEN